MWRVDNVAPVVAAVAGAAGALALAPVSISLGASHVQAVALGGVIAGCLAVLGLMLSRRSLHQRLRVLSDGINSLRAGDYGVRVTAPDNGPERALVAGYNRLADELRDRHATAHQHQQLLDSIMASTPVGLVLIDHNNRVCLCNPAAHALLGTKRSGESLLGMGVESFADHVAESLHGVIGGTHDGLISTIVDGQNHSIAITDSEFVLRGQSHRLIQLQPLTRELTRREIKSWKAVIRVISHELNNSLAPISSLAHSGRRLIEQQRMQDLDAALAAIQNRARHLNAFLGEYAAFARLPKPQPAAVDLREFVARLRATQTFKLQGDLPSTPGWFDATQVEQALINLLKNAVESESPEKDIELQIENAGKSLSISVLDRGVGMSDTKLSQALLPFYTTKPNGSGLGLALCRDIAQAHNGRLAILNRVGGGMEVKLELPM